MTESRPASTMIGRVLIAYPEQPGMTIRMLQIRLDGLVSLFALLVDPAPD
jgi:hypothetical protein